MPGRHSILHLYADCGLWWSFRCPERTPRGHTCNAGARAQLPPRNLRISSNTSISAASCNRPVRLDSIRSSMEAAGTSTPSTSNRVIPCLATAHCRFQRALRCPRWVCHQSLSRRARPHPRPGAPRPIRIRVSTTRATRASHSRRSGQSGCQCPALGAMSLTVASPWHQPRRTSRTRHSAHCKHAPLAFRRSSPLNVPPPLKIEEIFVPVERHDLVQSGGRLHCGEPQRFFGGAHALFRRERQITDELRAT